MMIAPRPEPDPERVNAKLAAWRPELVRRMVDGGMYELAHELVDRARLEPDDQRLALVGSLQVALRDPDPRIRVWCVDVTRMLAEAGVEITAGRRLIALLEDPEPDVRRAACALFARIPNELSHVQLHALYMALAQDSASPSALRSLIHLIARRHAGLSVQHDSGLGDAAARRVIDVATGPDGDLRRVARRACAHLYVAGHNAAALDTALPGMLADALDDEELDVTFALVALRPPSRALVAMLQELAGHETPRIRVAALRELARSAGDPQVVVARRDAFDDGDRSVQASAIAAASVEELLGGLRDPRARVRRACALRLFEVPVSAEVQLVLDDAALEGVGDPDPLTAAACAALCAGLGARAADSVGAIVPLSQHSDEDVAAYATHALSKLLAFAPALIVPALLRVALRTDRAGRMDMASLLVRTTVAIDAELTAACSDAALGAVATDVLRRRAER